MKTKFLYKSQIKTATFIAVGLIILLTIFLNSKDARTQSRNNTNNTNSDPTTQLPYSAVQELASEALSHYYDGNFNKAIEIYNEILKHYPSDVDSRENLAAVYRQTGDYESALRHYITLTEIDSSNVLYYKELAWTYLHAGKHQQALDHFSHALTLGDQSVEGYYGTALALCLLDKHNDALPYFEKALDISPKSAMIHADLAQALEKLGDISGAISHLTSAMKYEPSAIELILRLGDLYLKIEDYPKALEHFKKVLNTNSSNSYAREKRQEIIARFPGLDSAPTPVEHLDITNIKLKEVSPPPPGPSIRVGLINKATDIWLMGGSNIEITDKSTGKLLKTVEAKQPINIIQKKNEICIMNSSKTILLQTNRTIVLTLKSPTTTFLFFNVNYGSGYFWAGQENRQYRGVMEIVPQGADFVVVNIVTLEEYLYATVPGEMPASWPMEALKAQAVAARTYTVNRINTNADSLYHVGASVTYASYPGVSWEHSRSTQAVDETRGLILTYNGNPINAVYSSNTGGHTESSLDVWGFARNYLVPVSETLEPTDFQFPLDPADLLEWIKSKPQTFSSIPSYTPQNSYRWVRMIDRTDLEELLNPKYNLGTILQILPLDRGDAGSVYQIKIIGTKKDVIIEGDSIRSTLGGLRSNRFVVETQMGSNNLPLRFYFFGSGWGHNVGMSQTGAAGMAEEGFTYEEILQHYYPGTELTMYNP